MNHAQINQVPLATTVNLLREFPSKLPQRQPILRNVPVGIEVEVPWKAYFPDLWVEGFPKIDPDKLAEITAECAIREKSLVPRLMRSQDCGVKRGADRYWEFAFDPVTDVGIACDHVEIWRLYAQQLPSIQHSVSELVLSQLSL